jgi:hypothetical protein
MLAVKSDVQDVKSAIAELKSELKSEIREVEQRLGQRIDGIETRLNQHDLRFDNVHDAIRQQTRSFILASTGMMATLSAVAFGAATLI